MDWCFSCIKKDTDTHNEVETNKAKTFSKKDNSNCSSMIKNQKTNSNSNHNKSMSMFKIGETQKLNYLIIFNLFYIFCYLY